MKAKLYDITSRESGAIDIKKIITYPGQIGAPLKIITGSGEKQIIPPEQIGEYLSCLEITISNTALIKALREDYAEILSVEYRVSAALSKLQKDRVTKELEGIARKWDADRDDAIAKNPEDFDALRQRAEHYVRLGDFAAASSDYFSIWSKTDTSHPYHQIAKEGRDKYSDYTYLDSLNNLIDRGWGNGAWGPRGGPRGDRARLFFKMERYQEAKQDYDILSRRGAGLYKEDEDKFAYCKEVLSRVVNIEEQDEITEMRLLK